MILAHLTVAALVLALIASGCGGEPSVKVFREHVVERRDVERYHPRDPTRALLDLTRVLQSNNPVAVAELLTPEWRVTPGKVADAIPQVGNESQRLGVPKILRVRPRGRVATIDASWGGSRVRVTMESTRGLWRVGRVVTNGRRLQFTDVRSP